MALRFLALSFFPPGTRVIKVHTRGVERRDENKYSPKIAVEAVDIEGSVFGLNLAVVALIRVICRP